jgi:hypothetical protein
MPESLDIQAAVQGPGQLFPRCVWYWGIEAGTHLIVDGNDSVPTV